MKKFILMSIVLTFTITLFSDIIYVPDDEDTIQEAVDAASSGDVIVLRDNTIYEESVNLDSFDGGNLTIRSEDYDDWDCIESTIVDPISINDNVFERTEVTTTSSIVLKIYGLTIQGGCNGINLVETNNSYELDIQYCIIDDNNFSGVYSLNLTELFIGNCKIRGNGQSGVRRTNTFRTTMEIYGSEITGNNCYGVNDDTQVEIENCTIADNFCGVYCRDATIDNSIIWDNTTQITVRPSGTATVEYSDIEGGYGTGNIDEDPIFETVGDNDYCLTWDSDDKSPCIDTGDPNSPPDTDSSRVDMGAYYKEHEEKTYSFPNGWTWLSFDILNPTDATTYNQVQFLLDDIKDNLNHGEHEGLDFYYINQSWFHGDELVISPKGYKIEMDVQDDIEVSGFRCEAETSFNLYANAPDGNWIGYFLEETQLVYDAFGDDLNNIYKIKAQTWGIEKVNGVWPPLVAAYTLSPGDMVVVYCERDISDFCWSFEEAREEYIVPKSQDFTYTEEADYIPVFISLDPEDMPSEIGAYVGGECKGATVVQDTTTQICAYILENEGETLEFEFSYGGRGVNTRFSEYIVFDPETGYRETTTIDLREKQKSYYVSFKSSDENETGNLPILLSSSNYPNPFNPTTTIAYSLPNDGMIELRVYNIKGQLVKTLVSGEQLAGSYETVWNGKDNNENSVSSGIYFYKLSTKDDTIMKKILMLK